MTGVILVLIGIKNVTLKEMREYKLSHTNLHKIDEIIAWGVFYIIFGILILVGALLSFYPYLNNNSTASQLNQSLHANK